MPRSDIAYLRHILDGINRIEEYLHGVTEAENAPDGPVI